MDFHQQYFTELESKLPSTSRSKRYMEELKEHLMDHHNLSQGDASDPEKVLGSPNKLGHVYLRMNSSTTRFRFAVMNFALGLISIFAAFITSSFFSMLSSLQSMPADLIGWSMLYTAVVVVILVCVWRMYIPRIMMAGGTVGRAVYPSVAAACCIAPTVLGVTLQFGVGSTAGQRMLAIAAGIMHITLVLLILRRIHVHAYNRIFVEMNYAPTRWVRLAEQDAPKAIAILAAICAIVAVGMKIGVSAWSTTTYEAVSWLGVLTWAPYFFWWILSMLLGALAMLAAFLSGQGPVFEVWIWLFLYCSVVGLCVYAAYIGARDVMRKAGKLRNSFWWGLAGMVLFVGMVSSPVPQEHLPWSVPAVSVSDEIERQQFGPMRWLVWGLNQDEGKFFTYDVQPYDNGWVVRQSGGSQSLGAVVWVSVGESVQDMRIQRERNDTFTLDTVAPSFATCRIWYSADADVCGSALFHTAQLERYEVGDMWIYPNAEGTFALALHHPGFYAPHHVYLLDLRSIDLENLKSKAITGEQYQESVEQWQEENPVILPIE